MGSHFDEDGAFQSDKHPDMPPDRIRLNLANSRSVRALRLLAEDYMDKDPELAADLNFRLDQLHGPMTMQREVDQEVIRKMRDQVTVTEVVPAPHVRDKTGHQQRIEQFMRGCKQEVPMVPTIPSQKIRLLRARLILEEALETVEALGFAPTWDEGLDSFDIVPHGKPDLVGIADGCADLSVVTYGTLSACGVADESVLAAVDENNLEKLEKGTVDEHGKLQKPPGHQPPDLEKILRAQGWEE